MYSEFWIGSSSDAFSRQNGLKEGDALSLLLFVFTLEYAIRIVWGHTVIEALRCKQEGREFDSRWCRNFALT